MKIVCENCNYSRVDIMSIREEKEIINNKEVPIARIVFICPYCGKGEEITRIIYKG